MKKTRNTLSNATFLAVTTIFLAIFFGGERSANADVINMIVDSNLSNTSIEIVTAAGTSSDSSATSGTLTLDVTSTTPPAGNAQITNMNAVLDNGLNFSFAFGFVTATTAPNDLAISLLTPGPAGTISGGQFSQLGNSFTTSGDVTVSDPGGLVGGNQVLDLSTFGTSTGDFNNVVLSQSGNIVTLTVDYAFSQTTDLGTVNTTGTLVASGIAPVPEPSSLAISMFALTGLMVRRRRLR
jgi:hypothetical protein